jgi:septal ring factor EnvC (AmiA/AmiB activator)
MKLHSIFLFLIVSLALSAQSPTVQNMKDKRVSILKDIDHTNKLLVENEQSSKKTLKQIELLSRQIGYRKQVLELMNQEINTLNEAIINKENQIILLEEKIKEKKLNYISSIRKMHRYKNEENKFLFVFSAKSITQSYQRILYLKKFSQWQKKLAGEIADQQNQITLEKNLLEKDKILKQNLVVEKIQEETQLKKEEGVARKELENLKTGKKKLEADIKKKKTEADALDKKIEKIIREEAMAAAAKSKGKSNTTSKGKSGDKENFKMTTEEKNLSATFAQNKGKLPYPLKGNYRIVRYFGQYSHPEFAKVVLNCNGLEIETTPGNDARAVFDGTVMNVFAFDGFEKTIIIKHGDYITVYSNIESVYVKQGDKVTLNQPIGKITTDDLKEHSTILYFEIRKGGIKQDPFLWLKKN